MPTLLLRFPGGRYHATPWGHHVNEGLVEWPPSPWRILRALIATGYTKLGWSGVPAEGRALVERLASAPPRYQLPRAVAAHSRHYMPLGRLEQGRERTTLVFDTWLRVGAQPLIVRWDLELPAAERSLLDRLAANLSYLGRAESWVAASVVEDESSLSGALTSAPHTDGEDRAPGWEQVSLLAPEDADVFSRWRERAVAGALARHPLPEKKKASKKLLAQRQSAEAAYPVDLVACLEMETGELQRRGWSHPPGSRRILYWRPTRFMAPGSFVPSPRHAEDRVECVLLALSTKTGNRHALPSRTRTLPQAELLHQQVLGNRPMVRGRRLDAPELVGRDADGKPLKGHRHAHILPLDFDEDGHLDHVLVWAPMGIGGVSQDALRALRRTFAKGTSDLRIGVAAVGPLSALRRLPEVWGRVVARILGPVEGGRIWRSVTPFVAPRHLKLRGHNTLAGQVHAELASRGLPAASVESIPYHDGHARRLRHFVRARTRGGPPAPVDAWYDLRLTFESPIAGPLALGYGSHFGLGVFESDG